MSKATPHGNCPIVLIVDDTAIGRSIVSSALQGQNYEIVFASDGHEAITTARKVEPDVILLDVLMPGLDGYDVCRWVRSDSVLKEVTILLVTSLSNREERLKGLEAGADDFISKPFDAVELRSRVRTIIRLNRYRKLRERDNQLTLMRSELAKLENTSKQLRQLAMFDDLTNLDNRRGFFIKSPEEFNRAKTHQTDLSVLMIDVDIFKGINDTFGHEAGDYILKDLTIKLKSNLRATDIAGRLGGDEFVVLLPHTPLSSALILAERLRKSMESELFQYDGNTFTATISIGAAALTPWMENINDLLHCADKALYQAKMTRNKVSVK